MATAVTAADKALCKAIIALVIVSTIAFPQHCTVHHQVGTLREVADGMH